MRASFYSRIVLVILLGHSKTSIFSFTTKIHCRYNKFGRINSKIIQSINDNFILEVNKESIMDNQIPLAKNEKNSIKNNFQLLINLLRPGDGQQFGTREKFHQMGLTRNILDPQIWTHSFFIIAALVANQYKVYDLLILLFIVTPLSTLYHVTYEKPGLLAQSEGIFAKMLFLYGFIQVFRASSIELFIVEFILLLTTLGIFIGTNINKHLYDPYHCLMHVVPSFWAIVVAMNHTPLLKL